MTQTNSLLTIGVDTSKPQQILAAMSELQGHLKTALAATPLPKLPTPDMVSRSDLHDFALALGFSASIAGRAFNSTVRHRMVVMLSQDPPKAVSEALAFQDLAESKTYQLPVAYFAEGNITASPKVRQLLLLFFMAYGYETPDWLKPA